MSKVLKRIGFGLLIAGLALALVATAVQARNPGGIAVPKAVVPAQPGPVLPATYTLEELQNAQPIPLDEVVVGEGQAPLTEQDGPAREAGPLQVTPGWDPQSGLPQPVPGQFQTLDSAPVSLATWGAAPANPLAGPYPPFQRWTWYAKYSVEATQTIGKLFVDTDNNGSYDGYCTASVIGTRTIATSGNCVNNGAGTYYYHFLFCPGYYKGAGSGAPLPGWGCWVAGSPHTSASYNAVANPDRNEACLLTNPVGDTYAGRVGDKTGWSGVASGGAPIWGIMAWGYPTFTPFPGYHIIANASTQWYTIDFLGGGPVTTFIGSDMTYGAAGGPWWIGVGHRTAEYADVDANQGTDPGGLSGPWLYGVTATRRCAGTGCGTYPPTATDGPYWNELGSPEFSNDGPGGDLDEPLDVFGVCWAAE